MQVRMLAAKMATLCYGEEDVTLMLNHDEGVTLSRVAELQVPRMDLALHCHMKEVAHFNNIIIKY